MRSNERAVLACLASLMVAATGCVAEEEANLEEDEVVSADLVAASPNAPVLKFDTPRRGIHHVVTAGSDLTCRLRVDKREFDVPAGAAKLSISPTAKTMCVTLDGDTFCHVSGTRTGFCDDRDNNIANALFGTNTIDGRFLERFLTNHRVGRVVLSGHSQGAYDVSRVAPLLRSGDQLVLLQPAAAALTPNRALLDASDRGVLVHVAFSPNDDASIGIRNRAGDVPVITFPEQDPEIKLHNAPNARDLFLRRFNIAAGKTFNPALDASILSNPNSQHGPWRFPEWR